MIIVPSDKRASYLPNVSKLLQVKNDYFCAGAVFERRNGVWVCIQCAPILHWMRKVDVGRIKLELLKRGCSYEWVG